MATQVQGTYEVRIEEVEYLRHGDTPYIARFFRPVGEGPLIVDEPAKPGGGAAGRR